MNDRFLIAWTESRRMIHLKKSIHLYDHPLFTRVHLETPSKSDLNLPSDACITYILEGDDQMLSKEEDIVARKGHTILSICGLTMGHVLINQPKGTINSIIVHFNQKVLNKVFEGNKPLLWEELNRPITKYIVQNSASELIEHYFMSVLALFDHRQMVSDTILELKLKEIVLMLLRTDNSEYVREIIKSLFSQREFTFKEIVDAHIQSTASLQHLALATNCSVSTFRRRFKDTFKTTPAKYKLQLQLEKVAEKLVTCDDAISTIGYDCGFHSPEQLSRAFKRSYGLTPGKYRLTFSIK